ncbi:hypothetical protein FXO38_11191 [Capsicum annuum]|nr:hypothetical protein FXO38_11191 [Capsicum annuum]
MNIYLASWLKDNDPYVRKTVAICVAKIYDINSELVEDRGFLDALKDLISNNNPMVVANVVAAFAKIQESSSIPIFEITSHTLSKLLTALNKCTENIDQLLLTFKEYATEIDVDFVRKAVRAIGRCPIKLERVVECCISVLLELIKIKVNYVVQEAIIVIKDIFRRYPNTYEFIITTLYGSLDTLDELEAKASVI